MIPLRIAFLPLTDCAILVAAKECGFAENHDIQLELVRDVSWATVRDRLVYRQVDAAHLLAPLAIAVSLGLSQHPAPLAAPFMLGLNGNAVTFSTGLASQLAGSPGDRVRQPGQTAKAFAKVLSGMGRRPVLAAVHRFSSHALMLRYWLAYAGIDPDRDIELRILPPSLMTDALLSGEIDGFSAGEPWNSVAVEAGAGEIVALGCRIWESGPEKVLAMREDWLEANAETVNRLLRALDESSAWCSSPENWSELANMLSSDRYVGRPPELIERALSGCIEFTADGATAKEPNFLVLHKRAANFPWRSQALWIYSQLLRWGFVAPSAELQAAASRVFRSDIYRRAMTGAKTPLPGASLKVEGSLTGEHGVGSDKGTLSLGPDRFFDGRIFDPAKLSEYLTQFDR
ncbi:MAG TPA: CmpA/NrtA family ABC transporter substrate-binding protein [Sphingomicrobium sp.]|nr:CmpA/NrtA family ABC transporter substrate-binding protein [Sphingomicrobium sp.]